MSISNARPPSNRMQAVIPRVGQALQEAARTSGESIASAVRWLQSKAPRQDHTPRTNTPVKDAAKISDAGSRSVETAGSSLSGAPADLTTRQAGPEALPQEQREDLKGFLVALGATSKMNAGLLGLGLVGLENAFELQASLDEMSAEPSGAENSLKKILPREILESSLRNPEPESEAKQTPLSALRKRLVGSEVKQNLLHDPDTGFIAGIAVKMGKATEGVSGSHGASGEPPEVIINFPHTNHHDATSGHDGRRFLHALGILPVPKNFEQAAKLVRQMKQHLSRLNKSRGAMGLPPVKLTVVGQSTGGAMATYAALRADKQGEAASQVKIRAVAINPSPLGYCARARIGEARLASAEHSVTAIAFASKGRTPDVPTAGSSAIGKAYGASAEMVL